VSTVEEDVGTEIVRRAGELVGRIWGHFNARFAEFGLSGPEAKALLNLEVDRPLSMRELATRIHASPSNVTVTVVRLESRGLVEREGGDDRRVKSVRLTPQGADVRQRVNERLATDHPALRGLTPAERDQMLTLLRKLTD
jgi:DNA-binding MarR family transcriptional regulator